jgi:branched-chain amino acid transport system ATP-binding protein
LIIRVNEVVKQFGGLRAVNSVSFDVKQNEILGIIGPNGAGKTTLFNLISGSLPVTSGTVEFNGEDITSKKPYVICKKGIGRTYQVVKPFGGISVLENVMVGAFNNTTSAKEAREFAMEILKKVGLDKKKDQIGKSLTIADKKRLEVAKALATRPKLLLLDEVMAGLNPTEVQEIIPVISSIRDSGVTIIIIEHIMEVIMTLSDRIVVIHHGEKIAEGTPNEIANNEEVIKAYFGEAVAHA